MVDTLTRCEADRDKLVLELRQSRLDLATCQTEVGKWPGACPLPAPVSVPKRDPLWPVLGYIGGVVGTLALTTALVVPMPDLVRWGMGVAGAATTGISVILVLP